MEIVLLEDVKALGKKGQVVKVNDGYARNFILPKKLGVEATSKNLNDLKLQKANDAKIAAEQLAAAKELAEKLNNASVTVSIKAGEGAGHLVLFLLRRSKKQLRISWDWRSTRRRSY